MLAAAARPEGGRESPAASAALRRRPPCPVCHSVPSFQWLVNGVWRRDMEAALKAALNGGTEIGALIWVLNGGTGSGNESWRRVWWALSVVGTCIIPAGRNGPPPPPPCSDSLASEPDLHEGPR